MIIENICFLIPIHPPNYYYLYNLINKLKYWYHIHIDIYLIFSNHTDYDAFEMKSEIHSIIIEEPITHSIVTFKKFFGLSKLADSKYDYIICCDSEIDIISSNFTNENINQKIKSIFDNLVIYAGDTSMIPQNTITMECANVFPDKYEQLKNLTENFNLYFWFSDLPVYRRTDIKPFLNIINHDKINNFDYVIYQFYLILFHNFKIINTTPITKLNWSLEKLYTNDSNILNKLLDINYGFSWNTKCFYEINKNFIESQKGFLIYHCDWKSYFY